MIINRYLQKNIIGGSVLALLVLVGLSLFFEFVRELDDLGQGDYGMMQVLQYLVLVLPGKVVEFLPLAVLLGCMLSLGSLASNSEIIALQASGISMPRLIFSVMQAALLLAVLSFAISEWVVPASETSARNMKSQAQNKTTAVRSAEGLWIKDENRVVRMAAILPNGIARQVEIFELQDNGKLSSVTKAGRAVPLGDGWVLHDVEQTVITETTTRSETYERIPYAGNLSQELLQVLMIEPRQMSIHDLNAYLDFLDENKLDGENERLILWQKIFSPLSIFVMCLLAIPFILGPQRQANTGYRLMVGIIIGLSFVVADRLMAQLGIQLQLNALIIAALPNLLFLLLAAYLFSGTQSHGIRAGLGMLRR